MEECSGILEDSNENFYKDSCSQQMEMVTGCGEDAVYNACEWLIDQAINNAEKGESIYRNCIMAIEQAKLFAFLNRLSDHGLLIVSITVGILTEQVYHDKPMNLIDENSFHLIMLSLIHI